MVDGGGRGCSLRLLGDISIYLCFYLFCISVLLFRDVSENKG